MLKRLKDVGEKPMKDEAVKDAENLRVEVYAETLAALTKQKEGSPYSKNIVTSVEKFSNGRCLTCWR